VEKPPAFTAVIVRQITSVVMICFIICDFWVYKLKV
jgi:hypothetical protein